MKPLRTRLAPMAERLPLAVPLARRIRLDGIHMVTRRRAARGSAVPPARPPLFVVG